MLSEPGLLSFLDGNPFLVEGVSNADKYTCYL